MPKLTRYLQKIFANNSNQVGVFGTGVDKETSKNVETLQSADYENGWSAAVITDKNYPIWQEMDGVQYGLSYQIKYLQQAGIPEWLSTETYYTNSFCRYGAKIYYSLQDDNTNHNPALNDGWWDEFSSGGGLEIGDIGIAPLGIDETRNKRRYLNGQVIIQDQYTSFTNKLKSAVQLYPSLACTEAQWQATVTLSVGGQCGNFVIDDTAGTIRLPKIIMPIQGLTNLANLAKIVEAGLPNITGYAHLWGAATDEWSGAFFDSGNDNGTVGGGSSTKSRINFNASRSSSIYGNSTTVQQEQIQYPYFIQVATGVEESVDVTREIELNNPFCLLDYKYSEYELDNISWLRSNGQYNSKAVFPDAYDLLLKIYNGTETKAGVSVKLSTQTYADTDFVLNTSDETFRLPLKVALASGKAVVGNGIGLGLTNGTQTGALGLGSPNSYLIGAVNYSGLNVGSTPTPIVGMTNNSGVLGVTTDPTKSGIELSDANLYLYFYVGETVQNANLINAGRIEEKLASVVPDNSSLIAGYAMPSGTKISLTLGASGATYQAPADGWYEFVTTNTATQAHYTYLVNETTAVGTYAMGVAGVVSRGYVPVKKNDYVSLSYFNNTIQSFYFVYAQGSESEAS